MKAILCKSYGLPDTLTYEEIDSLTPSPKQVVISVKACSVNFPDTLSIQGKYQIKAPLPFSPGSDVSGIIKEVGSEVKHLKAGDEVLALAGHGGMAEEVLCHSSVVFPKPPKMDFDTAAAFIMVYATSYHALKDRAQLQPGETLVVLGASGGVGHTAVELGKIMGAKVIAAASTKEKLEVAKSCGADEVINYSEENLKERIKALTDNKGANVIYDPVGGDYTEQALRATAWGGRYLVLGFAAGHIPKIPLNLPLLKVADIRGVFWGSFVAHHPNKNISNMMELIQLYNEGKLHPHISKKYSLKDAPQAISDLMNRKVTGKIIINP